MGLNFDLIFSLTSKRFQMSGVSTEAPGNLTSYETTPKWHSFFFDQTGRFSGQRRRSYETTCETNSEPQNNEYRTAEFRRVVSLRSVLLIK